MVVFTIHSMALGKCSTEHALQIDKVNQIQSHFDNGMLSCGAWINLKKAFDTVDHWLCILLQKLHHFQALKVTNDWFHSYLTGRIHSTQIGSEPLTTACSVN